MFTQQYWGPMELITIGLRPGEKLLESIRQAVAKHGITSGAVVSGVGTLKTCRLHYVNHTGFPSENIFYTLHEPLELLSVSGLIVQGEPHLHVVVSCRQEGARGGHLEDGSEVLYLAEIAILKFHDGKLRRTPDPQFGTRLLSGG